jgi:hypothetical protein
MTRERFILNANHLHLETIMSFAVHTRPPSPVTTRVTDLPRRSQFLILTLRLAQELSIENRNFQGFVCALCGISRVERALGAIGEILWCVKQAPRRIRIESTVAERLAEDERRLLALIRCREELGQALAASLVPLSLQQDLVRSLRGLADALD